MRLGGEHPRENKSGWAAKIHKSEGVVILFNITRGDDEICG